MAFYWAMYGIKAIHITDNLSSHIGTGPIHCSWATPEFEKLHRPGLYWSEYEINWIERAYTGLSQEFTTVANHLQSTTFDDFAGPTVCCDWVNK